MLLWQSPASVLGRTPYPFLIRSQAQSNLPHSIASTASGIACKGFSLDIGYDKGIKQAPSVLSWTPVPLFEVSYCDLKPYTSDGQKHYSLCSNSNISNANPMSLWSSNAKSYSFRNSFLYSSSVIITPLCFIQQAVHSPPA